MARGSVVKRPSGLYAIVYPARGRQVWETVGKSKRGAESILEQRLDELRRGTWRHPRDRQEAESELTLACYAARWLERQDPSRVAAPADGRFPRRRVAASTFYTYRGDLDRHVLPTLGAKPLAELTTEHVDGLIVALERTGKAPGTIRNIVIPLRKLLGEAVRQGLIPANPASGADLPPAQDFAGKEIPPGHCSAIWLALARNAPPDPLRGGRPDFLWPLAFAVALGTGVRFGELRALRWRDVDLERQLIRVERAYSGRELTRPKSEAGSRAVPIFASARRALQRLGERAIDHRRYGLDDLLFATAQGTPVHPSNFYRRTWRPALERAELLERGYRWHDLRHTCVSRLVAAGADVALVQAVAGHADPRLTLARYTHLRDTRVSEAAERFGDLFGPSVR